MDNKINIVKVEKDGDDGVLVTFSDGTITGYVTEELLLLRPRREVLEEPVGPNIPAAPIVGESIA